MRVNRLWQRAAQLAVALRPQSNPRDVAGGLERCIFPIIIGDGKLHYGEETILETYYNWRVREGINLAIDFQGVANPAYNRDRGPVAILGLRLHMEF